MPRRGNFSRMGGDCHFEAVGDAPCAVDEDDRSFRWKNLARGLFEQVQPAVEVFVCQRQFQVGRHGAPLIAAGLEDDGRPEGGNLRDVMVPVVHCPGEDWTDDGVFTRSSIKRGHQLVNGGRVDGGMRLIDENGHDRMSGCL